MAPEPISDVSWDMVTSAVLDRARQVAMADDIESRPLQVVARLADEQAMVVNRLADAARVDSRDSAERRHHLAQTKSALMTLAATALGLAARLDQDGY